MKGHGDGRAAVGLGLADHAGPILPENIDGENNSTGLLSYAPAWGLFGFAGRFPRGVHPGYALGLPWPQGAEEVSVRVPTREVWGSVPH